MLLQLHNVTVEKKKNGKQEETDQGLQKAAPAKMLRVETGGRKGKGGVERAGQGRLGSRRALGTRFGNHLLWLKKKMSRYGQD